MGFLLKPFGLARKRIACLAVASAKADGRGIYAAGPRPLPIAGRVNKSKQTAGKGLLFGISGVIVQ